MKALPDKVTEAGRKCVWQFRDVGIKNGLRHLNTVRMLVEWVATRRTLYKYKAETPNITGITVRTIPNALWRHVSTQKIKHHTNTHQSPMPTFDKALLGEI
jgi:hypothetical protein